MDWTQIIVALLGTGGFVGLFLITERKTKAQMANMQIMLDNYKDQVKEYADQNKELRHENNELHKALDKANTQSSINEMKRCDCITCVQRIPPLADIWKMKAVEPDADEDNC